MKKLFLISFLSPFFLMAQPKLRYQQNQSFTYQEVIETYNRMAKTNLKQCHMEIAGKGDNGRPIVAFIIEPTDTTYGPAVTVLINNGIHPGEPDGIDASIEFAQKILQNPKQFSHVKFVFIPIYNVDGASVQSCCTRANQNGPSNQGFRGNARNLDLNRDFIKADAANTFAFYTVFHRYQPHILIDNHVSNGADYQYTMTLITSQLNKLGTVLGNYVKSNMEPAIYKDMANKGNPIIPYVNTLKETADSGLVGFLETPRFATGYAALFHCIGFVPETHMLKPFASRVTATIQLMESICGNAHEHHSELVSLKKEAIQADLDKTYFPLSWQLDTLVTDSLIFNGYKAGKKTSQVSGLPRLYYDRAQPFSKKVPFFNSYSASDSVLKPTGYVIPQGWHQVIARLKANGVLLSELRRDTIINVVAYYITNYETGKRPYEGHYGHSNVQLEEKTIQKQFFRGDLVVETNQPAVRFLMETLEPRATDSYFNWNFFDSMLQQKEYFSDYVFEDTAAELLQSQPDLKKKLDEKKATDAAFAKNGAAQLDFIYRNSPYYETTHNQYPIFRLP